MLLAAGGGAITPSTTFHAQQPTSVTVADWGSPNGAGYNQGKTDTSCSTAWIDAGHTLGSWSCRIATSYMQYTASSATFGGNCQGGTVLDNLTIPPWSLPKAGCVAALTASLSGTINWDPVSNSWICNASDPGASFVYTDPSGTSLPAMQVSVVAGIDSGSSMAKASVRGAGTFGQTFTVVGTEDVLCYPDYADMPMAQKGTGNFEWRGVLTIP